MKVYISISKSVIKIVVIYARAFAILGLSFCMLNFAMSSVYMSLHNWSYKGILLFVNSFLWTSHFLIIVLITGNLHEYLRNGFATGQRERFFQKIGFMLITAFAIELGLLGLSFVGLPSKEESTIGRIYSVIPPAQHLENVTSVIDSIFRYINPAPYGVLTLFLALWFFHISGEENK